MHPDWARSIRDQCKGHDDRLHLTGLPDVAFFFKQWGEWHTTFDRDREDPDWRRCDQIATSDDRGQWLNLAGGQGFHGERVVRVSRDGKRVTGRLLDGREWSEMPAVQREVDA
jgi:protein gp37